MLGAVLFLCTLGIMLAAPRAHPRPPRGAPSTIAGRSAPFVWRCSASACFVAASERLLGGLDPGTSKLRGRLLRGLHAPLVRALDLRGAQLGLDPWSLRLLRGLGKLRVRALDLRGAQLGLLTYCFRCFWGLTFSSFLKQHSRPQQHPRGLWQVAAVLSSGPTLLQELHQLLSKHILQSRRCDAGASAC